MKNILKILPIICCLCCVCVGSDSLISKPPYEFYENEVEFVGKEDFVLLSEEYGQRFLENFETSNSLKITKADLMGIPLLDLKGDRNTFGFDESNSYIKAKRIELTEIFLDKFFFDKDLNYYLLKAVKQWDTGMFSITISGNNVVVTYTQLGVIGHEKYLQECVILLRTKIDIEKTYIELRSIE